MKRLTRRTGSAYPGFFSPCGGKEAVGTAVGSRLRSRHASTDKRRLSIRFVNGGRGVGPHKEAGAAPLLARPVGNRSDRDRQSQESCSRIAVWETPDRERSVVNRVINAALSEAPPQEGRRQRGVGNAVRNAERRCRSNHGVGGDNAAKGGWMDGRTRVSPPAPAPCAYHWNAVEESVEVCESNRRSGREKRSGWVVPFSSGGDLRAFQRQRKRNQPPPRRAFWGFVR